VTPACSFDCALNWHDVCNALATDPMTGEQTRCECDCHPAPEPCAYVTSRGSRNPDSPAFGPNDLCGEFALPGSEYCAAHQGGAA
jgi:hypothetical protein